MSNPIIDHVKYDIQGSYDGQWWEKRSEHSYANLDHAHQVAKEWGINHSDQTFRVIEVRETWTVTKDPNPADSRMCLPCGKRFASAEELNGHDCPIMRRDKAAKEAGTNKAAEVARFAVLKLGPVFAVRDTVTELDAATSLSRSGAQHIADCLTNGTMTLDSLGRAVAAPAATEDPLTAVDFNEPRCVHGFVERPADRGAAIKACDRKPPAVSVGVFSDEGCVEFFDCAVEASDAAARRNAEEGSPAGDPMYRWAVLCAEHAEQAKDTCDECATEGCGAVDADDLDACGECSDCTG